ncbi:hypothetical protein BaRGS_00003442 [Batillaria attramentaria]|uniref:CCHC-type domain-containing protein n=1 Tax=Batillaria attramentaria TaxID=370345 RepID=A0ABD0M070_9CAEN
MGAILCFLKFLAPRWLVDRPVSGKPEVVRRRKSSSDRSRRSSRRTVVTSDETNDGSSSSSCSSRCWRNRSRLNQGRTTAVNTSSFMNGSSFSQRRERIPEIFNGTKSDSLKDWLCHFETCSRWNSWDYAEKGVNLAMSLRGPAQQVLGELSPSDLEDFDSIKAALERRFDPAEKENLHRVEFRSRMKKKDESVAEYGFALNRIATHAYPRMPAEARETIVIDQFVNGLPSRDLRRHVQFHHPSTVHEAMALVSEFESFGERFEGRKPEDSEKLGVRNLSEGEADLAKAFKDLGDRLASEIQKLTKGSNRQQNRSGVQCYKCKEKVHYARQCPMADTNRGDRNGPQGSPNENAPPQGN